MESKELEKLLIMVENEYGKIMTYDLYEFNRDMIYSINEYTTILTDGRETKIRDEKNNKFIVVNSASYVISIMIIEPTIRISIYSIDKDIDKYMLEQEPNFSKMVRIISNFMKRGVKKC